VSVEAGLELNSVGAGFDTPAPNHAVGLMGGNGLYAQLHYFLNFSQLLRCVPFDRKWTAKFPHLK